ncbi:MAG: hypothetical protein JW969_12290 [Spirochaetales bacterium]|nr:hypothetical protein [Spirochaetales bacterium]
MDIKNFLQAYPFHELAKYSSHPDFSKKNVAFTGSPKKHPYDPKKIILISDPFSSNTYFYEFKLVDITHIEELSSIVTEKGDNLNLVKIWVKKGSLGIRYEPFIVEDTVSYLRDTEVIFQYESDES